MDYKQLKYEVKDVHYHDKRELIKATDQDYVPAIVTNGKILTYPEIPDYLEELAPNPSIYPNGTRSLAKLIENWAHYRLEEIVWRCVVADLPKIFKDDLERWVFVEIQEAKRGSLELMEARKPAFKADMGAHLEMLDEILIDRKFLLADAPSLADFAAYGAIHPLYYSGNEIPQNFKNLRTWYNSIDRI